MSNATLGTSDANLSESVSPRQVLLDRGEAVLNRQVASLPLVQPYSRLRHKARLGREFLVRFGIKPEHGFQVPVVEVDKFEDVEEVETLLWIVPCLKTEINRSIVSCNLPFRAVDPLLQRSEEENGDGPSCEARQPPSKCAGKKVQVPEIVMRNFVSDDECG